MAGTSVSGHPSMANIMKLAEHRSKLKQGKQKLDHEIIKAKTHVQISKADTEKMRVQMEADKHKTDTQLKLMRAKKQSAVEAHNLKKQDMDLQHLTKKKDLDFQRKSFDLEKRRTTFKQKSQAQAEKAKAAKALKGASGAGQTKQTRVKNTSTGKRSTAAKTSSRASVRNVKH